MKGAAAWDDLRHIRDDGALRLLLGLSQVSESDSLGDGLRRQGQNGVVSTVEVNRHLLKRGLHLYKQVTLDIDATLSASQNQNAKWTYKQCTGYMPMVGTIAETGMVVATDFREGNVPPSQDNLAFIHQCEAALPEGVAIAALRSDAAGYQVVLVDECIRQSASNLKRRSFRT